MATENTPILINDLRTKVTLPEIGILSSGMVEEDASLKLAAEVKSLAVDFAKSHQAEEFVINVLSRSQYLEEMIVFMGYLPEGQKFILNELKKIKPDLTWFRGGTLTKWRDQIGPANYKFFTQEELDTDIIDGGKNGSLGRPSLALAFLKISRRPEPVFYSLTLDDFLEGLQKNAISLSTDSRYDLCVNEGKDRTAYLDFCRTHLKIQRVKIDDEVKV